MLLKIDQQQITAKIEDGVLTTALFVSPWTVSNATVAWFLCRCSSLTDPDAAALTHTTP